jgi:hypothetical protein
LAYCDLERIKAESSRQNEPNFRPAGGGSHAIAYCLETTKRTGGTRGMSEPSRRSLPVAFNASLPPEPSCDWSERGLFPLVFWNSAFSRHFSTFYGPSVQAMDIPLNALQHLLSSLRAFFWLLELRVSRTFLDQCGPSFQAMDIQVTRQRSGTGRPSVEGDRAVRRPCPSQRNKSHKKENARQSQLCGMPP